ncbi:histidine--tRNA ligase [bacterium]|nr:MAG: histidine--tRNA ligase [bacterium]
MRFQSPRGTQDILPTQVHAWQHLEAAFREVSSRFGYHEIRTPMFEETEVFTRTSGDTSDIVTKQMYTFMDKGDRSITLRPEGTAPVMRSVLQHNLCPAGTVLRLSYTIPFFRYERPQKGRYRQAHQFGLELVGSGAPTADAEIIEATAFFYKKIGLDVTVSLNSIGRDETRAKYRTVVLEHFAAYLADQTEELRAKAESNPLRLLDIKDPAAKELLQDLPPITDYLEESSRADFDTLQGLLTEAAIPYRLEPSIVRGLDYYTGTVFEIESSLLGAQSSLCGGGRYDGLVQQLGGPALPAVGVGMGIERMLIALEESGRSPVAPRPNAFVISPTPEVAGEGRVLARALRAEGHNVEIALEAASMKSQLRQAVGSGARFALILGPDEIAAGTVQVRDLDAGSQSTVARSEVGASL